jgi:hypothetical protein
LTLIDHRSTIDLWSMRVKRDLWSMRVKRDLWSMSVKRDLWSMRRIDVYKMTVGNGQP